MRRRTYTHLDPSHRPHRLRTIARWAIFDRLAGKRRLSPPGPGAPRVPPDLELLHRPAAGHRLTWIGHASFLCELAGTRVLVDPHFSGNLGFYPRHVPAGLRADQLPPIDGLLITHSHPDHLDARSVRSLPRDLPVIAPAGLGRWFHRRGFLDVTELLWWQSAEIGRLRVTLTPARHWSRRGLWDTNRSLWGGYVMEADGVAIYHAGDSAYCELFRQIGRRFPDLMAALLPIGAYSPAWFMEPNHMNPEQAGQAFLDLGARHLVPMHWGTYQLADEPLAEPAERIRSWWASSEGGRENASVNKQIHLLAVGETLTLRE